jgi:GT2 family glycosyltransferase
MMIRTDVFKKIGLFDEEFFLYYEDVDFCLRAKKAGFGVEVVPSSIIHHVLSQSAGPTSSFTLYHLTRSAVIFGKKYYGGWKNISNRLFLLFQSLAFLRANPQAAVAIMRGLLA